LLRYISRHTWPSLQVSPPRPILSHPMVSSLFSPMYQCLPPIPSRPPRDQQGNLVVQPGDCLHCCSRPPQQIFVDIATPLYQVVGRWILCVCQCVCAHV
jgi:hypothetical protein